ncbi:polysaccharide deacetylase family protein [Schnuerera ultunensis]|uniref:hypothetical protein n=1 Tax=Schnuerera ultunensis TaxID=45497 RepID=UPI0004729B97|nr:hypothetical protein [Schnuerera ultunensis]
MKCSFTNDHYEYICKLIKKSPYRSIFFNDRYSKGEKILLLRHDIDQSPEKSLTLAEIEKKHGVKSTYFIWLTSPFYNIFENHYSKILYEIMSLGHQIGLHFDERSYNVNVNIRMSKKWKITMYKKWTMRPQNPLPYYYLNIVF